MRQHTPNSFSTGLVCSEQVCGWIWKVCNPFICPPPIQIHSTVQRMRQSVLTMFVKVYFYQSHTLRQPTHKKVKGSSRLLGKTTVSPPPRSLPPRKPLAIPLPGFCYVSPGSLRTHTVVCQCEGFLPEHKDSAPFPTSVAPACAELLEAPSHTVLSVKGPCGVNTQGSPQACLWDTVTLISPRHTHLPFHFRQREITVG